MWRVWRPHFGWKNLCPVLVADPFGFLVVMARATAVTPAEVEAADTDDYPSITAETKAEDYGRIGSEVVAVDYGLPDAQMTKERRTYYEDMVRRRSGS